jgi:hypothetical protein
MKNNITVEKLIEEIKNNNILNMTKDQIKVLMNFYFIDGHINGVSLIRDEFRNQIKDFNFLLKYSDVIKAFGTFTNFVNVIRAFE